jgi:hypothetical protein
MIIDLEAFDAVSDWGAATQQKLLDVGHWAIFAPLAALTGGAFSLAERTEIREGYR